MTNLILQSKSVVLAASKDEGIPGPENFSFQRDTVDSSSLKDGDIMVQVRKCTLISSTAYISKRAFFYLP
jgi:hypothetical protein